MTTLGSADAILAAVALEGMRDSCRKSADYLRDDPEADRFEAAIKNLDYQADWAEEVALKMRNISEGK